jgi:hypothetical protein
MAVFFTRKSHAARLVIRNSRILIDKIRVSDIFDSHHPLHNSPPRQPAQAIVKRHCGMPLAAFVCSLSHPKPEVQQLELSVLESEPIMVEPPRQETRNAS